MQIYTEKDVDVSALKGARVAVLGYGSQGRAHALNLRDSGFDVVVGLRKGVELMSPEDAVKDADLICMLVPDIAQKPVYEAVEANIKPGAALSFAHGFNIHFDQIHPKAGVDCILVAPKGPGDLVRRQFEEGRGVPCLIAVAQDATGKARDKALAYAHAIGGTRGGVLETTFAEETETDLFGEQAVLCGGATELVLKGYETLVEAGYQPEVAYFECLHELKLIVDLLNEGGLAKMHEFISETAKYGDLTRGPRVIDDHVKAQMKQVLTEVQDGTFARQWIEENKKGLPEYNRLMEEDMKHPIEEVGRKLRARMSWLKK
jgi:ketol-acid reductoisomerase